MKFKCGLTEEEEKARLDAEVNDVMAQIISGKRVFAWLPKRVAKGDCRWLEFVNRKVTNVQACSDGYGWETIFEWSCYRNYPHGHLGPLRSRIRRLIKESNIRLRCSYEAIPNA